MKDRLAPLNLPDQSGRTWLVTGATNGVGREVARAASRAGARVLLTARDGARGEAVRAELGDARVIALDLSDQASIHAGATQVDEAVDVLVNNAGHITRRRLETVDGLEATIATNFFGPFAFTNLVLDRVRDRIVIVGSNAHRGATLDLDDLQLRRRWSPASAYARSKLADMLWGLELERRLRSRGVQVMLAHPGWALTNLQNQTGSARLDAALTRVCALVAQSAADSAQTVLTAATHDLPPGSYVGPSDLRNLRGTPTLIGRSADAADVDLAARVWEIAARTTGTDAPAVL